MATSSEVPLQQPPPPPPPIYSQQESFQQQKPGYNIPPLMEPISTPESPTLDLGGGGGGTSHFGGDESCSFTAPQSSLTKSLRGINQRYQLFLDKISPHWKARWTFAIFALILFMARVIITQGWYIICYALAIYYLNLLIGFISPRVDPSLSLNDDEDSGPMLPSHANDEFKPFIRRLPEFKFWVSGTKATLIALFMSLFEIFDVPVFWPILLIYFLILFACTMRQQIEHMIKYGYVPWDSGKKKYAVQSDSTANLYPTTV